MDGDDAPSSRRHNSMMGRAVLNKGDVREDLKRAAVIYSTPSLPTRASLDANAWDALILLLVRQQLDVLSSLLFGDGNNTAYSLAVPAC